MQESTKLVTSMLRVIYRLLKDKIKYIILDGTQWERGKKTFHLLTLCIVYQNIAIPSGSRLKPVVHILAPIG
jgi:hypothetical protein